MSTRISLNVSLTPELENFVQQRVANGRYQAASEVVREALRLLEQQEQNREAALKTKLKRGSSQVDEGRFVDPDHTLKKIENIKSRRPSERT